MWRVKFHAEGLPSWGGGETKNQESQRRTAWMFPPALSHKFSGGIRTRSFQQVGVEPSFITKRGTGQVAVIVVKDCDEADQKSGSVKLVLISLKTRCIREKENEVSQERHAHDFRALQYEKHSKTEGEKEHGNIGMTAELC